MADQQANDDKQKKKGDKKNKEFPAAILAEDMNEDQSKEAIQVARDAFALTITSGDVHSQIADFIRKKFDRDFEKGWNCIVGRYRVCIHFAYHLKVSFISNYSYLHCVDLLVHL